MAQHPPLDHRRCQIVEREHRVHTRQRERGTGVDRADRGMGMRAAHEGRVPRAGNRDVVDVASLADEQGMILEARDARADQR